MRTRALWMLGLALFLAGAAVFLARSWLETQVSRTQREATAPKIETTPVVVAAAQFQFGSPIRREHLRVVNWPSGIVPQGAFASVADIIGDGQDRVALRPMEINEPVLASKVSGFGGRASLSSIIAADMRASTIRVNDVNGVAGFVLPGDRVDIMLTRAAGGQGAGNTGNKADNLVTDLLLQNVKILGVDQDANENRDKPAVVRTVTLEVTVEQSQKLVLAQQIGTLSLALRNISNTDAETAKTVGLHDLGIFEVNTPPLADKTGDKQPAPAQAVTVKPAPKADTGFQVRIVRGTAATQYDVQQERGGPLLGATPRSPEPAAPRQVEAATPPAAGPAAGGPPTLLLRPAPAPLR